MLGTIKADYIHHLPDYRERTEAIKYIIIHCSKSKPKQQIETLERLGLSAHFIIGRDGKLYETLEIDKVAFHAGISSWRNSEQPSLNGSSIGIELESPDMGQSKRSYTPRQITKLCLLLRYLTIKYKIRRENILGHSDIAPTRKPDPGAYFPWQKLHKEGLGIPRQRNYLHPSEDEAFLLNYIGYDISNLPAARYAFCRRWLKEEIIIEQDIQYLVDNPFPKDFTPKDYAKYLNTLRYTALGYAKERQTKLWYE